MNGRTTGDDPRRIDPMRVTLADYVVVDLETTGLHVDEGDRPVEIGAARVIDGEVVGTFSTLIDPHRPVPEPITRLTGIDDRMVAGCTDAVTALRSFDGWLGVGTPVMAHNARFDIGFLDAMTRWSGGDRFAHPWLDTLEMARRLHPMRDRHSVAAMIVYYGIGDVEEHRALSDALQEQRLYEAMKRELRMLPSILGGLR